MNDDMLVLLTWSVAVACLLVLWQGHRRQPPGRRQLRRVLGAGAAVGGLALMLFSMSRI